MMRCAVAALAALMMWSADASGAERVRVETLVSGLEHPWALAFLPDGDMLVTERTGALRRIAEGRLGDPISGVPASVARGQGGLLDIALDPDFAANRLVYLSLAAAGSGGLGTEVWRGVLEGDALLNAERIFAAEPKSSGGRHFGSRLLFAPDGTLYVTLGERGEPDAAQDVGDHRGSVARLTPEGGVPPDNPLAERAGARPEIFSYGHRNPQGMALEPETGRIYVHEHGPRGGDEVNALAPGANYGWPVVTHGLSYAGFSIGEGSEKPGMAPPIHYWVPSIAASGMAFYDGDAFPEWRGDLLVGGLKCRCLAFLDMEAGAVVGERRLLSELNARIRDVRVGPDGLVYLLTDAKSGALLRLSLAQ